MPQQNNVPVGFSRRRLLKGMAVLSLSNVCASLFPAQLAVAQQARDTDFADVSSFLVSRRTSQLLGQRYLAALNKHYADFAVRLNSLAAFLDSHHFAHVDDFLQAVNDEDPLRHTAALIIGSWYTGVVGEGADRELIAYAEAMMYLPTRGILVVPTYGGGPDSWGSKPQTEKGKAA
ncbi:sugar dehydrogenase complex small subunit [Pantoea sp. BAV 3049]|uniref:sugar dehydrogenase complex small subunit n=1 Tax=Pantoea sp. BAV 3049 TaxID=2654188 RepID=UPI00131E8409|nr:sugar dehydrogenase complex small subunit [Pantoea sp. BAV 3049]